MNSIFFETPNDFREWLDKNHQTETELWVGYYKKKSTKISITWSESVDQALCYGWIDGIRKSIDDERYTNRFTPRRKTSIWSRVNIEKIEKLRAEGLMMPAGEKAYEQRTDKKSIIYSYEKNPEVLDPIFENTFKAKPKAWAFFNQQAPSYIRLTIHWIMSAKQEKTKLSRLKKTIQFSEEQKRVV
ncbi:MAG: YdeI/OmpD-associated family protein [Saprospiraceae bacterium]